MFWAVLLLRPIEKLQKTKACREERKCTFLCPYAENGSGKIAAMEGLSAADALSCGSNTAAKYDFQSCDGNRYCSSNQGMVLRLKTSLRRKSNTVFTGVLITRSRW